MNDDTTSPPTKDTQGAVLGVAPRWNERSQSASALLLTLALAACLTLAAVAAETAPAMPAQPAVTASPSQASVPAQPAAEPRKPDVVFVPTPQPVVEKMLELAELKTGDVVYDLGCGDGRIVVTAAKKYGVKAVGFDIDPQRVKEALENVRSNQVEHLVTIKQADIFTLDLRPASVVTLYLLPELNVRLMPQLEQLKPGSRIVSHDFDMRGAKPVLVHQMSLQQGDHELAEADGEGYFVDSEHTIYKWVVPWVKDPPPPANIRLIRE